MAEYALERGVEAGFLLAMPQRLLSSCVPAAVEHWRRRSRDLEIEDEFDPDDDAGDPGPLVERLAALAQSLPSPEELAAQDSKYAGFLDCVRKLLRQAPDEKLLVFSTFRSTLRYLDARLRQEGFGITMIHGGVPDRDLELERFATDRSASILLSSEVGSEGIDLQFCRVVINYDLPWNPMRIEQRIGRVDRLGQASEAITVINLLSEDTIDSRIYHRLYERLDLIKNALGEFEAVLGEEIQKLTADLLSRQLTPAQQEARISQTAQALENKKRLTEELEEQAAALIAHGDHIIQSIHAAHDMNRWIGSRDLADYLRDSLAMLFPGCALRPIDGERTFEMTLTSEARLAYSGWLEQMRLPRAGRLEREYGPVRCVLGRPAPPRHRRGAIEAVTQTHTFVRFVSARLAETDTPKLRPAVAAKLSAGDAGGLLAAGDFAILAELWRFGGLVDIERIAFAGMNVETGEVIDDDVAERLLLAAAQRGQQWHGVGACLNLGAVATRCEQQLEARLTERFADETRARRAEQQDRAAIQTRAVERHLGEQRGRLRELIDRQRRDQRVRGSVIAANEGRLRRLEEVSQARLDKIRRSIGVTSQREALVAALVRVQP